MTTLTIFLLGILFAVIGLPFIQGISDIIYALFELVKAKISIKITKYAVIINDLKTKLEPIQTNAVGFDMSGKSEEIEYDEEYEENKMKKSNRRVGF